MPFNKTTKLFQTEVALEKNGQIIRLLRSTGDTGFSQFNDEYNGKGFLIIRASSDNKQAIMNILRA